MFSTVFLAAAALTFSEADSQLAFSTASEIVEKCTPRDAGTIRGRIAANLILDRASAAGADARRDTFKAMTPKGEREFTNVYAEFRSGGENDRWVVLVSHYDTKPGAECPGANDGASTSGLLVGVANALSDWPDRHGNVLLVWTDGEESAGGTYTETDGFQGSKRAAEYILSRNYQVQAVICLDMLGDRDLSIIVPSNGSPALAKIAVHAANRAGLGGLVTLSKDLVKDDHVAFLDKGMKAIDLIDFSYGPQNAYWHTKDDSLEHISQESLLKSGRLVAELLNILL